VDLCAAERAHRDDTPQGEMRSRTAQRFADTPSRAAGRAMRPVAASPAGWSTQQILSFMMSVTGEWLEAVSCRF